MDHGVKEDSLSEAQNATSAEGIDEIRKRNIAYEYLCHLEEVKMWLEAVLREKLPPTTELEESLRHGVYLAKLGHFIAPEVVPESKIYDLQLQRYNVAGLQFRHTDNINYWLKALVISGLPKTFHPETADVYDKKGMPKVIYCLHALSTYLFKMGRAPLIQALNGKINFTDDEISNVKQALENNGIPMPAFQKIGGLLSEDLTDDTRALHDVIVKINHAVDQKDTEMLLHALENKVAKLHDVKHSYIKHYCNVLRDAKISKVKAAMNRSFLESFTADEYDELLTQAEVQGHITSVNVIQASHLLDAVKKRDFKAVENVLKNLVLGLTDNVSSVDSPLFLSMLKLRQKQREGSELWLEDVHAVVKDMLYEVHEVQKVCASVSRINMALQQEDPDFTMHALTDAGFNVTGLSINRCYSVLKKYKQKKMAKSKGKWIIYQTKRGNTVFLDAGNYNYSWVTPEKFDAECQYLSLRDIEKIIGKLHEEQGKRAYINEVFIVRLQSYIRGYFARKLFGEMKREKCALIIQEEKVIKIQSIWRGRQARKAFISLFHKTKASFQVIRQFAPYLNINNDVYTRELQLQNLKAQVTQVIRHNQQLAKQLDTMKIKIGLLDQNRISLLDVIAHSKNLHDLALRSFSRETVGVKDLKSLTKDSRRRSEDYQHLFYMLQTCPNYLAKLLFCLPKDKPSMFIKTVIWSLFNFGINQREECLLLKLFCSALREEVQLKFTDPAELITSAPLVLHMVADYARQTVGPNSLQNMIGPLVQKVLDDKTLVINTNPVDIYKIWRNQEEMKRGVVSELPASVSPEQALLHPEVQKRLATSLNALKSLTAFFS